jgi:hypothetical protein
VIATVEAVVAVAMAAARAASASHGGTCGADHARASVAVATAAAAAAAVAIKLLGCHVAWLSEEEAGLRKAPPPRPKASTAGEAGPSSGRGSARTVSRRVRRTRARDAEGLQAEAEVAEGGAEEAAPPASSAANQDVQDVRHESKIPAEHRQPDTEITSGGGDEPDGVGTDSASSWDTVEDDGGAGPEGRWKAAVVNGKAAVAGPEGRWKAAVVNGKAADAVDGGPGDGEPDAADRPIVARPGAAAAGAGRPTRPRDDGGGGAAAAAERAAKVRRRRAAAEERGRLALARSRARSVITRGGFPLSPAAKKKPRTDDVA